MGRKRKAGCVPVRRTASGQWELLLVQSRWTPSVWLFPKGGVEDDEKAKEAATRETLEEGGVEGRLGPKLGVWSTGSTNPASSTHTPDASGAGGARHRLKMWLLFVDVEHGPDAKAWKERKKRLRAWHSFQSARAVFASIPPDQHRPELVQMLEAAQKALDDPSDCAPVDAPDSDSDGDKA